MSHGVFINGRRPKSKKEVKEAIQAKPDSVYFENTSMLGGKDYSLKDVPDGLTFVGPDPFTKRNFYGSISRKGDKIVIK